MDHTTKPTSSVTILANEKYPGMIQIQIMHSIGITLACDIAEQNIDSILKAIIEARDKFKTTAPLTPTVEAV